MRYIIVVIPVLLCSLASLYCVRPPDYPDEPVITFKSMSKNVLKQQPAKDSILLSFTFTDGDGDLGNKDSLDIFVVDGRNLTEKSRFRIPFIEPQGTGNGINGEISINVLTSCCIYVNDQGFSATCQDAADHIDRDTLYYLITIRDRAGHVSNQIQSDPIILLCK